MRRINATREMVLKIFTLQVTHKLLSLKQSTEDTLTSQWNLLNKLWFRLGGKATATISKRGDLLENVHEHFTGDNDCHC